MYKQVSGAFDFDRPVILQNQQGEYVGAGNDIGVFHPPWAYSEGRPDWLSMDGYRKPSIVELEALESRTLLRAFVASEPDDAIPMDQILIAPGQAEATLMLPVGDYRLVRQDEAGENYPLGELSVQPSET